MLRAVGMTDDDWGKPQVGVASSWNEVTPCNMPARPAGQARQGGRARRRRLPARVHHHRRERRHLDGPRGHAGLAGQPRDHRRLGRAGDARRAPRRPGRLRRLRQVAARHAHGLRPGSTCRRCSSTAARSCRATYNGRDARHRQRVRGRRRRRPPAPSTDDELERDRAATPARPRARAPACSPPTPWRRSAEAIGMALPGSAVAAGGRPAPRRRRPATGEAVDEACSSSASGPARS